VLLPLAEIAPEAVIPGRGAVLDLLAGCARYGVQRLAQSAPPAALAG
jgi:2-amino-4-hydroxy-6-hydroxymethyldihydropteridine diphosphokinase